MAVDPNTIAGGTTVRRRDDLAFVEVDGETIVWDPVEELLHHLDPVATAVWRELDGSRPLSALAAGLATSFEAPVDTVAADVVQLARKLAGDGLVVCDESGGPAK